MFPSSNGTTHRKAEKAKAKAAPTEEKKREYTPENVAVVKRVRACKVTEYYEILAVSKDCEEADVKRAYRKVRSQLFTELTETPF